MWHLGEFFQWTKGEKNIIKKLIDLAKSRNMANWNVHLDIFIIGTTANIFEVNGIFPISFLPKRNCVTCKDELLRNICGIGHICGFPTKYTGGFDLFRIYGLQICLCFECSTMGYWSIGWTRSVSWLYYNYTTGYIIDKIGVPQRGSFTGTIYYEYLSMYFW